MVRSSSNVSWMVLFSTFLRFTAFLLLLGCLVKCELQFVGHGRHELDGEKIVKLKGNTKIAEKPEDLKPYKESEGSCDVDMDNEGNIKIWYQKNSNTTEKGCSLDMITKKEGPMSMKFGIWHNSNLTECLGDTEIKNHTAATENILPFSFSLKNEEFNTIKKGPSFGTSDDCKNVITCNFTSSECLKVADYSVAWARTEEYVSNFVFLIGDGVPDPCPDDENMLMYRHLLN
ncbi:hypothetical protein ACQ4LE_005806 [Meloidogyne hapla]|uniref:Uncharacterized protein n=1 Tax=Meloidogyne hapla TaxID=6305 RepID=A0A1I8B042_MELHA